MRPHRLHAVFHGEVAVGSPGTVFGGFLQTAYDFVLHFEREASPGAELRKIQLAPVGECHLFGKFAEYAVHVGHVSQRTVLYFGYDGKQRDFVKGGLVQIVRDFNVQVPVLVQMDAYLLRLEAEGGEPLPIDPRQEAAVAGHVLQLFGSEYGLCQAVHRLLQFLQKRVRIGGVVSVLKTESTHGIGKQFDVGIRGGEFVKVCIEYGMNHGRIFFGLRFWG